VYKGKRGITGVRIEIFVFIFWDNKFLMLYFMNFYKNFWFGGYGELFEKNIPS